MIKENNGKKLYFDKYGVEIKEGDELYLNANDGTLKKVYLTDKGELGTDATNPSWIKRGLAAPCEYGIYPLNEEDTAHAEVYLKPERVLARVLEQIYLIKETLFTDVEDKNFLDAGRVCYMNSNDGTMYDFIVYSRTCEFGIFYESDSHYAIKAWLSDKGVFEGYAYNDPMNHMAATKLEPVKLCSAANAHWFAKWLEATRDIMCIQDEIITSDLVTQTKKEPEKEKELPAWLFNDAEIVSFKNLFSKYCMRERHAERCSGDPCACSNCPVNDAYMQIFDSFEEELQ